MTAAIVAQSETPPPGTPPPSTPPPTPRGPTHPTPPGPPRVRGTEHGAPRPPAGPGNPAPAPSGPGRTNLTAAAPVTPNSPPDRAPAPGRVVPPLVGPAGLNSTSGGAADRGRHPASSRQADDVRLSRVPGGSAREATTSGQQVGADVTDRPVFVSPAGQRAAGVQGCPPAHRTGRYSAWLVDGAL